MTGIEDVARALLAAAIEEHNPSHVFALFSGRPVKQAATCPRCKCRDLPLWSLGGKPLCASCIAKATSPRTPWLGSAGWVS